MGIQDFGNKFWWHVMIAKFYNHLQTLTVKFLYKWWNMSWWNISLKTWVTNFNGMCSPNAFTTWLALLYRHWDIMVFTLAWTIILMQFTSFLSASCAFVSVFDIWDWFRDFECDCKEYFHIQLNHWRQIM